MLLIKPNNQAIQAYQRSKSDRWTSREQVESGMINSMETDK
jgi:hypothetical protein